MRLIPTSIMELSVRKDNHIGDRNWSKRPLFASPRRRYAHWWLLLLLVIIGVLLFLFPNLVNALIAPLFS